MYHLFPNMASDGISIFFLFYKRILQFVLSEHRFIDLKGQSSEQSGFRPDTSSLAVFFCESCSLTHAFIYIYDRLCSFEIDWLYVNNHHLAAIEVGRSCGKKLAKIIKEKIEQMLTRTVPRIQHMLMSIIKAYTTHQVSNLAAAGD